MSRENMLKTLAEIQASAAQWGMTAGRAAAIANIQGALANMDAAEAKRASAAERATASVLAPRERRRGRERTFHDCEEIMRFLSNDQLSWPARKRLEAILEGGGRVSPEDDEMLASLRRMYRG